MDMDGFLRFCLDFEVFPDIISKPKLVKFFNLMSEMTK